MSSSLLCQAFSICDCEYFNTKYKEGAILFTLHPKPFEHRCANCRSTKLICRGTVERRFRSLSIGNMTV